MTLINVVDCVCGVCGCTWPVVVLENETIAVLCPRGCRGSIKFPHEPVSIQCPRETVAV